MKPAVRQHQHFIDNRAQPASGGGAIEVGSLGDVVGGSGSDAGTESLGPILVVGGIAAAIGAGIAFAPQIEQALADAGIELPPLP